MLENKYILQACKSQINNIFNIFTQKSISFHPQQFQYRLIRFWGWQHRHRAAAHHPVCDSTMWPCGPSIQMATFLSACLFASLPVSLSQLHPAEPVAVRHGSCCSDSSLSLTANQHHNIEWDLAAYSSLCEGVNYVCLYVFPQGVKDGENKCEAKLYQKCFWLLFFTNLKM